MSYYQGSDLQVPGSELSSFFPESQLNVNESSLISPRFSILNDNWEAQIFYSRTESELEATQDVFLQDNLLEQTGNEIEALIHYSLNSDSKLSLGAGYYDYDFWFKNRASVILKSSAPAIASLP